MLSFQEVSLGSARGAVLAFDVGGTSIKAGLVDESGRTHGFRRIQTPQGQLNPGEAVLDRVGQAAQELMNDHPGIHVAAVGLSVPGLVNPATGTGIYSENLGWRDFPFKQAGENRLGLPLAFGHDVAAAGTAELHMGGIKHFRDVVVIVIGTGIAAAVFCNGQPVLASGYAGEIGQVLVPDPRGRGTTRLESVASAAAIVRRCDPSGGEIIGGADHVLKLAAAGDSNAQRIWDDALDALAFAVVQCVSILGTEAVIIGGGLSQAGDALIAPLRDRVDKQLIDFQRRPRIFPAHLGQDAGLIGTALNARALLAEVSS